MITSLYLAIVGQLAGHLKVLTGLQVVVSGTTRGVPTSPASPELADFKWHPSGDRFKVAARFVPPARREQRSSTPGSSQPQLSWHLLP